MAACGSRRSTDGTLTAGRSGPWPPGLHQAGLRARVARRDKSPRTAGLPEVPTDEGGWYLATWEDPASGQIVGGACDRQMTPALPSTALDCAVARPRPPCGVLPPADRGSPWAATK
jgi:hypothetical protein